MERDIELFTSPPEKRCICGHSESMHYAVSGACQKIITRNPWLNSHLRCTCKQFREEKKGL